MTVQTGLSTVNSSNHGFGLFVVSTVMVILSGLAVTGRIAARASRKMFGMDDYMILLSMLFSIGLTVTVNSAVVNGYGQHKADLSKDQLLLCLKWFYIAQVFYKFVLAFDKLSMLFLYLRIFTDKNLRRLTYGSIGLIIGWGISSVLVTIFECIPVQANWNKLMPGAVCINDSAFWYAFAITNTVTDALIFALPIREVFKLKLAPREKMGLIGVFALGAFVCVTSIIRTTAVANSIETKADITYNFMSRSSWTLVEANTGIICACLPVLRQPLRLLFPRVFGGSGSRGTGQRTYALNSRSKDGNWARSDGFVMSSAGPGRREKGPYTNERRDSSDRGSEEHINAYHDHLGAQRRTDRDIVLKTDIHVSYHGDNAESVSPSLKHPASFEGSL
ncbi:MAG: hypothetical protein M4579_005087 [Chaenotheca gracillima]|nr:MAG: hypothetical protein M4579_005087 [Chaenotheca gracillima]